MFSLRVIAHVRAHSHTLTHRVNINVELWLKKYLLPIEVLPDRYVFYFT